MKQLETISKIQNLLPKQRGIQVALLIGSFGRNDASPNSDIDIQLIIDDHFQSFDFIHLFKQVFENDLQYIHKVDLRDKIVAYFKSQPKVEFSICKNIDEIKKNYIGSEIIDIERTILYTNSSWKNKITTYLKGLISAQNISEKQIHDLIEKFIYEFESCSNMHRRSDAYRFYFFYNIALQVAVQLKHLSSGETKFNFLPKYFLANVLNEDERKSFYDLKGTLFLPEANLQKRRLLDLFYSSIQTLVDEKKQEELKQFLEYIYERDFFWNFRDIATFNPKIKSGVLYRTATLTVFQNESRFNELLEKLKIKTIIDLRADKEIEEMSYKEDILKRFHYVKAPFDPWNQPEWFKEKYHYGTNEEIAYRFFALGCKQQIKTALESIINEEEATAIHCFAGKDRTGIFVSLLHLLVDSPSETIYTDYLASEVDIKPYRLEIVLNIIQDKGGIVPYLIECGLTETQIQKLKNKLLYGTIK